MQVLLSLETLVRMLCIPLSVICALTLDFDLKNRITFTSGNAARKNNGRERAAVLPFTSRAVGS